MAPNDEEILGYALDGETLLASKQAHLEQCEICQQRLASYKHVNATLITHAYRRLCPSGTQLSFYCANLLPPDEYTSIARHILDCPLCSAEVAETRRFMREVPIDVVDLPAPVFTPREVVRRVFASLVRQQAQLVVRGANNALSKAWPRQYHADAIDLSLHLSRASNGDYMLLGILTSTDSDESVDAFEGATAELYPAISINDMELDETITPCCQAIVDDLGNLVFSTVPVGNYILLLHLLDQEVVIEGITIEHG